jgi:glutamate racemase
MTNGKGILFGFALILAVVISSGRVFAAGPLKIMDNAARMESSQFSLELQHYTGNLADLPIGVFDSGVGGLTVLDAIIALDEFNNLSGRSGPDGVPDFEHERFVYLGDQANMPYGNYPAEGKTDFLRELIVKDALFLLGNRYWPSRHAESPRFDKPQVKAIVIACNTATAYGYNDVLEGLKSWGIPVYLVGVVNAGAKGALSATGGEGAVAVMATVGTCASQGYVRAVGSTWSQHGLTPPPVVQQGCLGLAGSIEGDASFIGAGVQNYKGPSQSNPSATIEQSLLDRYGFEQQGLLEVGEGQLMLNSVENYVRYHALTLVESYAATGASQPIGGVILGCTHFPFYTSLFGEAFSRLRTLEIVEGGKTVHPYRALLAESVIFIDPARDTAVELYEELHGKGLLLKGAEDCVIRTDEFYISVTSPVLEGAELDGTGAFSYEYKYGRDPGWLAGEYVRRVPMTRASMLPDAAAMVQQKLPSIWDRLLEFNARSPRLEGAKKQELLN